MPTAEAVSLRVGVIGRGVIGAVIAASLDDGEIEGATLAGVLRRQVTAGDEVGSIEELIGLECDLVVEAAGHEALRRYATTVLTAGIDLIVLSAGGLADEATEREVKAAGPGKVLISTGAIGGLDMARAMMETGAVEDIIVRSTTTPAALDGVAGIGDSNSAMAADGSELVMAGSAREVALRFPHLANVTATVALATLGLDRTRAELLVDPSGTTKRHELTAIAAGTRLRVRIENSISELNPRTSAVTPYAVVRLLRDRLQPFSAGV